MERRSFYHPTREIPANAANFRNLENSAIIALYQENFNNAVNFFQQAYRSLLDIQIQERRGIHKGSILYNLGIAVLGRNQENAQIQSLDNILLAYIEDTINTEYDFEDDADRAPAGRFLIDGFVIQLRLLREIKRISRDLKNNADNWLHAYDPQVILNEALQFVGVDTNNLIELCQRRDINLGPVPLGFPQPVDRRVFIGLNYDTFTHLIPEIRLAVIQRNYVPILVRDVIIPPTVNVHDVSLLLLHTCRYAVFDITDLAGQLMELERARDYNIKVLIIRSDPVGHPPHISGMINSLGYPIQTYQDMADLRQLIINFLP